MGVVPGRASGPGALIPGSGRVGYPSDPALGRPLVWPTEADPPGSATRVTPRDPAEPATRERTGRLFSGIQSLNPRIACPVLARGVSKFRRICLVFDTPFDVSVCTQSRVSNRTQPPKPLKPLCKSPDSESKSPGSGLWQTGHTSESESPKYLECRNVQACTSWHGACFTCLRRDDRRRRPGASGGSARGAGAPDVPSDGYAANSRFPHPR